MFFHKIIDPYPNCINGENILTILTVADCHGHLTLDDLFIVLNGIVPDIILLLGDNEESDLDVIYNLYKEGTRFISRFKDQLAPMLGIVGNHNKWNLLEKYPEIKDINGMTKPIYLTNGVSLIINGLGGSIKYKDEEGYALLTDEESIRLTDKLPDCDIFITHSNPSFKKHKNYVDAHSGLYGIGKYIKQKKPKIVLYGHEHERKIYKYDNTIIKACYGIELFEIGV